MNIEKRKEASVRVRMAPSPTGFQHIGNLRTAIYNYLLARKQKGSFILRIEDTDQSRLCPESEEYLRKSLDWLGIEPDESPWKGGPYGPYRQSERKSIYKKYALELVEKGFAYYAFDTPEEIEKMRSYQKSIGIVSPKYNMITRMTMQNSITLSAEEVARKINAKEPYVIRMKIKSGRKIRFKDQVRGWIEVESKSLDDKVLFKSDGMPTYHLASVVDDHLMKILYIIRGEEWLPSTPHHFLLYEAFGWEAPYFVHLPLILRPDGKGKLSKRSSDPNILMHPLSFQDPQTGKEQIGLREAGYLPEAVINFLALMGWHSSHEQEFFKRSELIDHFSLERIKHSGIRFDIEKATWINGQHLRDLEDDKLIDEYIHPEIKKKGLKFSQDYIKKVLTLIKERIIFSPDIWSSSAPFFTIPQNYERSFWKEEKWEEWRNIFQHWQDALNELSSWEIEPIRLLLKRIIKNEKAKSSEVLPLLRITLLGESQGPHIPEIIYVLGKDETHKRIKIILKK